MRANTTSRCWMLRTASNGGPVFTLLNPIGGVCPFNVNCHTAFYDDRMYRVSTGAIVNTGYTQTDVNNDLTLLGDANATNPPTVNHSDQTTGFDTSSNQRAYGALSGTGFGNWKGLDLWTYYPVEGLSSTLNVIAQPAADLRIVKSHNGTFTIGNPGGSFMITVSNVGTASISGLTTVSDNLPTGLTLNAAPTGTGWTCNANTPFTCTRSDALAAGASYPVITVNVNVSSAAYPTVTNTATLTNANDTDASNNTFADPIVVVVPDLSVDKTNDVSGAAVVGTPFHWSIELMNANGAATATFTSGQTVLTDSLPGRATLPHRDSATQYGLLYCDEDGWGDGHTFLFHRFQHTDLFSQRREYHLPCAGFIQCDHYRHTDQRGHTNQPDRCLFQLCGRSEWCDYRKQ